MADALALEYCVQKSWEKEPHKPVAKGGVHDIVQNVPDLLDGVLTAPHKSKTCAQQSGSSSAAAGGQ